MQHLQEVLPQRICSPCSHGVGTCWYILEQQLSLLQRSQTRFEGVKNGGVSRPKGSLQMQAL